MRFAQKVEFSTGATNQFGKIERVRGNRQRARKGRYEGRIRVLGEPFRSHYLRAVFRGYRENLDVLPGERSCQVVKGEPIGPSACLRSSAGRIERQAQAAVLTVGEQQNRFPAGA